VSQDLFVSCALTFDDLSPPSSTRLLTGIEPFEKGGHAQGGKMISE
jgi:hypothetical protein